MHLIGPIIRFYSSYSLSLLLASLDFVVIRRLNHKQQMTFTSAIIFRVQNHFPLVLFPQSVDKLSLKRK